MADSAYTTPTAAGNTNSYQNIYPDYWNTLTNNISNAAAGIPAQIEGTYNNWYNGNLAAAPSGNTQAAYNMAAQSNSWTPQINSAISGLQNSWAGYNQSMGQGLNTAAGTAGMGVAPVGQAINALNQAIPAVTGNMAGADNFQNQAAAYTSQMGNALPNIQAAQAALGSAQPYLMNAAQNYSQGSQYDANELQKYLNPYIQNAAQTLTTQSNRNLEENILPGVNSTFAGNGQFGSSRNADFTNRAIRDQQQNLTNSLGQLNYGAYQTANQNYSDWANKRMQAGTGMAGLGGQELQAGQAYGSLAGQQADLAKSQAQLALQNAGVDMSQAGVSASLYPNLASGYNQSAGAYGNLSAQQSNIAAQYGQQGTNANNYAQTLAQLAQQGSGLDQATLNNLLTTGGNMQTLQQTEYDKTYENWLKQQQYPVTALGGLSQVVGNTASGVKPDIWTSTPQLGAGAQTLGVVEMLQRYLGSLNGTPTTTPAKTNP